MMRYQVQRWVTALIVLTTAYGADCQTNNSPFTTDGVKEALTRASRTLASFTCEGLFQEPMLLTSSTGIPTGTPIVWRFKYAQHETIIACRRNQPVISHEVGYVAPNPSTASSYIGDKLCLSLPVAHMVLVEPEGTFLLDIVERIVLTPNNQVIRRVQGYTLSIWLRQRIGWVEMIRFATGRLPLQLIQSCHVRQLEQLPSGRLRLVLETNEHGTFRLEVDPAAHWLVRRMEWLDARGVGYRVETAGTLRTAQGSVMAAEACIWLLSGWEPIPLPVEPNENHPTAQYRVYFTEATKDPDHDFVKQLREAVVNPPAKCQALDYRPDTSTSYPTRNRP